MDPCMEALSLPVVGIATCVDAPVVREVKGGAIAVESMDGLTRWSKPLELVLGTMKPLATRVSHALSWPCNPDTCELGARLGCV